MENNCIGSKHYKFNLKRKQKPNKIEIVYKNAREKNSNFL